MPISAPPAPVQREVDGPAEDWQLGAHRGPARRRVPERPRGREAVTPEWGFADGSEARIRYVQHGGGPDIVWVLGGGSGHGFKHGPALGEMVAGLVLEHKDADPLFRLARFGK